MSSRDDFVAYELPHLLQVAREHSVVQDISCILLYGGANHRSYTGEESISVGSDYDCWVFFHAGAAQTALRYSEFLLAQGHRLLKRPLRQPVLLYEKIPSRHEDRILAPFITTADALFSVLKTQRTAGKRSEFIKSFPWYRITPRQRELYMPATAFDGMQISLELQQRYSKTHNLWRLEAPAFSVRKRKYYVSFAVEAFLTSSIVYDTHSDVAQGLIELAQMVARRVHHEMPSATNPNQQATLIYNTFTVAQKKATPAFSEACIERLTRWISQ